MKPEPPDDFLAEASSEHLITIGRIASSWSAFELMLDEAIWAFTGLNREVGACVTSQIPNVSRRLEAVLSLLKLKEAPDLILGPLRKFVQRTNELQIKRNGVVHAIWSSGPSTRKTYRMHVTARAGLKFQFEISELKNLKALLSQIKDHTRKMAIFLQHDCANWRKP